MTVQTFALPGHDRSITRILPSNNDPETYDGQILSGLMKALELIEQSAKDGSVFFQTYSIAPPPRKGLLGIGKSVKDWTPPTEFDPWNDETRDFWARVGRNPDLHQTIKRWLDDVLRMLERVERLGRSTGGLWEDDEVQFAEPAISVLAMVHPEFVPFYTRFLAVWDMDHEVSQHDTILQIFETHGITEQTENLIIVRTADGIGQAGVDTFDEVLPLLQDHYGNMEDSDFLKRLVAYHHAHAVSGYAHHLRHEFESCKRNFLKNKKAQPPKVSGRLETWFLENHPELSESAMALFEDLEHKRLAGA